MPGPDPGGGEDEGVKTLEVAFTVNGKTVRTEVEVRISLADFLRDHLRLTGTHLGCEHGVCGACTVLVDGSPVRSCLLLAVQADGSSVVTVEDFAADGEMSLVQRGFYEAHSFQCGFCTPGFVIAAHALLAENPSPTRSEIREALSGNICRCTGYQSIIDGVETAIALAGGERSAHGS